MNADRRRNLFSHRWGTDAHGFLAEETGKMPVVRYAGLTARNDDVTLIVAKIL
jgi:hypothetical protein